MKKYIKSPSRIITYTFLTTLCVAPLWPFISTWGGSSIGPLSLWKAWLDIIILCTLFFTVISILVNGFGKQIMQDRLIHLAFIYLTVVCAYALYGHLALHNTLASSTVGIIMNSRYVIALMLGYFAYKYFRLPSRHPAMVYKYIIRIGIALAAIGIIQVIFMPKMFLANFGYDSLVTIAPYLTVDDNVNALRAFATLRGPNDYGAYIILIISALLVYRPRYWRWLLCILLSACALSYSRSSWIGLFVCILSYIAFNQRAYITSMSRRVKMYFLTSLTACSLILLVCAFTIPHVRLVVFHSSPNDDSLIEGSTSLHIQATVSGVSRVIDTPTGCGTGCAGPASYYGESPSISENYYVQIAEELGVGGLALWLTLYVYIFHKLYQRKQHKYVQVVLFSGFGLSAIGLMLHVWADGPLAILWWGLAGIALGFASSSTSLPTTAGQKSIKPTA